MGRNRIRHDVMIASRTVIPFSSSRCANSTINMLLETTIPTILPDMNYDGLAVADGNQAGIVCHFTQLVARVVYLPKRGPSRVITGFAKT